MLGFALTSLAFFSCSGEDGKPGETGPKGDSIQGETGPQGEPGEDKPNVDFYFQNGFKGYSGTQDATINPVASAGNDVNLAIGYYQDDENESYNFLMRFDDIANEITSRLVDTGETCEQSFHINQAILYLYITEHVASSGTFPFYFRMGFYGSEDPVFDELATTWKDANSIETWAENGGGGTFFGPLIGDDYSAIYTPGLDPSESAGGWFPILLPRSVVESWVCDDTTNKGFRVRLAGDGGDGGVVTFRSSEDSATDLRPLLVIETEKVEPSVTTKGTVSNKQLEWSSMTYEEKMAPFYRYLASK